MEDNNQNFQICNAYTVGNEDYYRLVCGSCSVVDIYRCFEGMYCLH